MRNQRFVWSRNRGDNGFSALSQLPPQQYDTLKGMLDNLKWHLRDEIAFTLSTGDTKPTEENLLLVMDHVKTSKARKTCVQQHLPLRFVFNVDQSYEKFLEVNVYYQCSTFLLLTYLALDSASGQNKYTCFVPFHQRRGVVLPHLLRGISCPKTTNLQHPSVF